MCFAYLPACAAEKSVAMCKQLSLKSVEKGVNISPTAKAFPGL